MPIDGLASGLDTNSIITQLMALERQPRNQLAARRDAAKTALDAFKGVQAKLDVVNTAALGLQRATGWNLRSAVSSDPTIASVSASTSSAVGSFSFTVGAVARAHGVATGANVAATTTVIASSGTLGLTIGGTPHTVAVGAGSLSEVADAINAAGLGVRAATVNTGTGFRLQLSAVATGGSSTFTIDSGLDPVAGATVVTTAGTDASITLGTGPGAYSLTSASNTFTDVIPGVTVVARQPSATVVSIDVAADASALADKVGKLVDAVNGALNDIKAKTAYDPKTKTAAALNGDPSVRQLASALTRALADAVGQSSLNAPGLAGVTLDAKGLATFDKQKFLDSFTRDPAGVQRLFVQGATVTGTVKFAGATDVTRTGTAAVAVTALATKGTSTGLIGTWPLAVPGPVSVRIGTRVATYTVMATDTAATAAAGLQTAINTAGLGIEVTESGGGLAATSRNVGSGGSFEVAWDGVVFASALGTDAVGTIDGVAAVATGSVLTAATTQPTFGGLSVQTDGIALGAVGTISYEPGIAQRLSVAIAAASASNSGALAIAAANRQTRMGQLDTSIASYDRRLVQREATLRKSYAALEVTLGNLKNQSSWLTGQLATLAANNSSSNK